MIDRPEPYRPAQPWQVAAFLAGLYFAVGRLDLWSEQVYHLTTMCAVPRVPAAGQETR